MDQLGNTVTGWAKSGPIGKTKLYQAINSGELPARKNGSHTIILTEDFLAYLKSLPDYEPAQAAA